MRCRCSRVCLPSSTTRAGRRLPRNARSIAARSASCHAPFSAKRAPPDESGSECTPRDLASRLLAGIRRRTMPEAGACAPARCRNVAAASAGQRLDFDAAVEEPPSSVALVATGRPSPNPCACRCSRGTPRSSRKSATACARCRDSSMFLSAVPVLSVWPLISSERRGQGLHHLGGLAETRASRRRGFRNCPKQVHHGHVQRLQRGFERRGGGHRIERRHRLGVRRLGGRLDVERRRWRNPRGNARANQQQGDEAEHQHRPRLAPKPAHSGRSRIGGVSVAWACSVCIVSLCCFQAGQRALLPGPRSPGGSGGRAARAARTAGCRRAGSSRPRSACRCAAAAVTSRVVPSGASDRPASRPAAA